MVKIPTAQELTGRQINITPGAKPNFLLPANAMTEPFLQMADASQRAGNAIVDYAVSLQDAKNKTILNNAVLSMKDEMQTFQQELYRGQITDNKDGTQDITPYDPLKFSELLEKKKDSLYQKYVSNNKDVKGLLSSQIKSTFELEYLQISDAVNKEANKRIDQDHIVSAMAMIDVYKAELTTNLNLDQIGIDALYQSINIKLNEIQHKVPTQTFLNLIDEIKYDVAEGQFLTFSKNMDLPTLTKIIDLSKGFDFQTIGNSVVADTMKNLYETNPDMVQKIFQAAIKQQTDEITLENKFNLYQDKKEKRLENDYLRGIFLNNDEGDQADAARQTALTNLKNLKSVDYKTIQTAEAYLSDENIFADTTVESVYFDLNKNIRLGVASFDDILNAAPNLTKEVFQELMALQASGIKDLKSEFSKSIMNKYGVAEEFIDTDNPVHGIIVMNAAQANNELSEWINNPENKQIAGSAAFNEKREEIFDKYNNKIKEQITDQIKQGFGMMIKKMYNGKPPEWFDYNDLPGTIKNLKEEEDKGTLTQGQIMAISMVLNQYQGYFEILGIN
jgi:hypothetical protein